MPQDPQFLIRKLMLACIAVGCASGAVDRTRVPIGFESNIGQTDHSVGFIGRAYRSTLWFTRQAVTFSFPGKSERAVLEMAFVGANRTPRIHTEGQPSGVSNYILGNDRARWRTNVPRFTRLRYRDLYPGIDAVFYGNDSDALEYDLVLRPFADPSSIRLSFRGAERVTVDSNGAMILKLGDRELRSHPPRIHQNSAQGRKEIPGRYVKKNGRLIGFELGSYDRSRPLVIDPVLSYATFLGGSLGDYATAVATDASGNIYVTGGTDSLNFPTTTGLTKALHTAASVFISELSPAKSGSASLLFSTYFGGAAATDYDVPFSIAVDSNANVLISGVTYSADFPLQNAFQKVINISPSANCPDASNNPQPCPSGFVAKLAAGGGSLLYSSYVGGGDAEYTAVNGMAVDASGNAYLTGETASASFPVTFTTYQKTRPNSTGSAFLTKIGPTGALVYGTYLGGEVEEGGNQIVVDASGVAYIAGYTASLKFPVTSNALQSAPPATGANQYSGFLVKFNPGLSGAAGLLYSTYLGGSGGVTSAYGVAIDGSGHVYVTGATDSQKFPVTPSAYQASFAGLEGDGTLATPGDAFVTMLNPAASGSSQLIYSSFLGGSFDEEGLAVAVDNAGRITIAGNTDSCDLPASNSAYEPVFLNCQSSQTGFLARFDPTQSGAASLLYSSFAGGTTQDVLYGMAEDPSGNLVTIAGETFSVNAPITSGAYQAAYGGTEKDSSGNPVDGDAYVARFNFALSGPVITEFDNGASFTNTGISPGLIFTVKGTGLGPSIPQTYQTDANGNVTTLLSGVQVLVNGIPAPLLYVSQTQINALAPYALSSLAGSQVLIQVVNNNIPGNLWMENVVAAAPAIFSLGNQQGAIRNQDNSVNGPSNPATAGSVIQIFATGEGQTNPAGVDGKFALDFNHLPMPLANVQVSIGGQPATLKYSGAAPSSFAGFFQVDAVVPTGLASGPQPVILSVGTVSSPASGQAGAVNVVVQ